MKSSHHPAHVWEGTLAMLDQAEVAPGPGAQVLPWVAGSTPEGDGTEGA